MMSSALGRVIRWQKILSVQCSVILTHKRKIRQCREWAIYVLKQGGDALPSLNQFNEPTTTTTAVSMRFAEKCMCVKPGTHYPHVTWAHAMLRVQLEYLTLNYGAHTHFCHSAYVTWSDVELWSAHMPARLLNFCWRTHFVRRDVCHVSRLTSDVSGVTEVLVCARIQC
jgi:hypothetical protein